jgi:hypothetical protein
VGINKIDQPTVSISPTSASANVNGTVSFSASGGSGSGAYVWSCTIGSISGSGSSVTWTAPSSANSGSVSVYRNGDSTYNPSNTASASVSATPILYALTVNNGTGSGSYASGTGVSIYGNPPTGYHFTSWTQNSGPGTIGSSGSRSTTFTMGSGNATITANSANDAPIGWLDSATSPVIQNQNITGSGWAADNETGSPVSHVDILIDGVPPVPACQATLGGSRPDVASVYGRPDYTNSGYSFSYNIGTLSVGSHTISTKAYDAQGASAVLSGSRSFTVNPASSAPTITTQPSPQTITAGQNTSFTAAASGTPAPSVKWQVNTGTVWTDLANGGVYSGVGTNTLTLTQPPTSMSGYQFRLYAWNGVTPDATSSSATLTVNAASVAPTITTQPASQTVNIGNSVTLAVAATGTPAPSYQWKKGGSAISGATSSSYSIGSFQTSDNGSYTVTVTNSAGSVTSSPAATLTVSPLVQLSSYSFPASSPPTISTTYSLTAVYKLRAKVVNYGGAWSAIGLTNEHLADSINNNGLPLDHIPYSGTYSVELYWVQYDSTGTTVVQIGPMGNVQTIVVSMVAPVASAATSISSTGFTANWSAVNGATGYRLDVSTNSAFSSFVSGYSDRDVSTATSYAVSGLSASTTYYYRVRATNGTLTSGNSSTITAATTSGGGSSDTTNQNQLNIHIPLL